MAKLPAADETSRVTAVAMRSYEKEVRFYEQLADGLPIPTPTVFHAALDAGDLSRFVLILEDLAPATQGDQLVGCSPEVAADAVRGLVGLHAPRWGDPTLADIEWLRGDRETGIAMLTMLLPTLWTGFTERYAADLDDDVHTAGAAFFAHLGTYLTPTGGPETVVHGDYRLDNLLLAPGGGVAGVVDWQTCTVGPALSDVAYFIGAGLSAEDRRAHEEALVRDYHRELQAGGRHGLRVGAVLDGLPAGHVRRSDDGGRGVDARGAHRPRRRDVPHHGGPPQPARARPRRGRADRATERAVSPASAAMPPKSSNGSATS